MRRPRAEYVYAGLPLRDFLIQKLGLPVAAWAAVYVVIPSVSGRLDLLAAVCLVVCCPLYVYSVRRSGFAFAARPRQEPRRKQQAGHPRRRTRSQ